VVGKKLGEIFRKKFLLYETVYRDIFIYVKLLLFINMKRLDPSFFDMFDYSDERDLERAGAIEALSDYLEHPYILFGSVIRGVENYYIVREMMSRRHGEQFESIEESLQNKYFNRLFIMLERFDESNCDHVLEALRFEKHESGWALLELRDYFERIEEYEKCVKVQSVITALLLHEELHI
jgi:hypothetical protein